MVRTHVSKRGFTLIELLVVIAIIAILAAILFPVFAQARSKARQITGLSNMKQAGLSIMMYIQDYDEKFPRAGWDCIGNGHPDSNGEIPVGVRNACGGTGWQNAIAPYHKNGGMFASPGDGGNGNNALDGAVIDGAFSVLYNDLLAHRLNAALPDGGRNINQQTRLADGLSQAAVNQVADTIMLAEGTCGWAKAYDPNGAVLNGVGEAEIGQLWNGINGQLRPAEGRSKWYREQTMSGYQTHLIAGAAYTGWGQRVQGNPWYNAGMNFAFTDGHAKWFRVADGNGAPVICSTLPWRRHVDPAQQGFNPATQCTNFGGDNGNWQ